MKTEKNKAQIRGLISVEEAAKRLGIHIMTVFFWINRGRLDWAVRKIDGRKQILVATSSLKGAFNVTCRYCNVVFRATNPEKAAFCRPTHKAKWHFVQKSKGHGRLGQSGKKA
jgi:excisionase family DNA binding protein